MFTTYQVCLPHGRVIQGEKEQKRARGRTILEKRIAARNAQPVRGMTHSKGQRSLRPIQDVTIDASLRIVQA